MIGGVLLAGGLALAAVSAPHTVAPPVALPAAVAGDVALATAPPPAGAGEGVAAAAPTMAPRESALVELGRRLFFDPGASHSKNVSCASCHDPAHGYSDPMVVSADDFGPTRRHSQTLLNLDGGGPLHWDGEFPSIEDLVSARTGATRTRFGGYNPNGESPENLLQVTPVAESIAAAGLYDDAFRAAFGEPKATRERLSMALAWYVRSLKSARSPFDRFAAGDAGAIPAEAARGYELFKGRAGCASCHSAEGDRPAFTDGKFHNTGLAAMRGGGRHVAIARNGRMGAAGDEGRKQVSKREEDARAFKTPSLRDVALRAPYMHDGTFPTLDAVVRYYATECGKAKDDRMEATLKPFDEGRPADEVDRDVKDLVAFLASLTGETRAGVASTAWSERAPNMRLRFVEKGAPYRGPVAISPAGDDLPAAFRDPRTPLHLTPDVEGWIDVAPPATTHVRVSLPGTNLRPASGDLVPDTCREGVLSLEVATSGRQFLVGSGGGRVRAR